VSVEILGFTELKGKMLKIIDRTVPAASTAALAGAMVLERIEKLKCPVGHNSQGVNLRSTIHSVIEGSDSALVGPNSEHAMYVEFGTGLFTDYPGASPHRIVPVKAQALAWPQPNPTNFAASIAGMHPQPFVRPAFAEGRDQALKTTEKVYLAEIEKAAKL
jgi:HK97 gp10 family phage protein